MSNNQVYTLSQALAKAMKYCAYQERCQSEVRQKVMEWGCSRDLADEVIVELILQNFLNEERFARSYVRGKFNQKSWGKIKIQEGLKSKHITTQCIALGLSEIDEEQYLEKLQSLAQKKILEKGVSFESQQKVARFLYQKGYENSLIWETIKGIIND